MFHDELDFLEEFNFHCKIVKFQVFGGRELKLGFLVHEVLLRESARVQRDGVVTDKLVHAVLIHAAESVLEIVQQLAQVLVV